ncbi:MAG: oxidoreductase, partial [Hyphomicrobiales bacterium]|nr:oxidoreductase [Hyphomicrobiales bacterium]
DDFVLATKFSQGATPKHGILATGNSRKAMIASLEASLKRLKTDRVDLYWVHYADGVTPTEEILRAFDDLVRSGKILYAGLSDFPAWRVARAATIAELRGSAPIVGLQVEHSLVERTTEHDLLPMGQALGLGIVAWSPIGGGMLTGKYRLGEKGRAEGLGGRVFQPEDSAQRTAILDAVIATAKEIEATPAQVAIAWVASKGSLPIIGPRTRAQLDDNLAATQVNLSPAQLARLDEVSAIAPVFPHSMLEAAANRQRVTGGKFDALDQPLVPVA